MNKNLKLVLNNHSNEQGFALPIALGMGLIMLLIAATMVMRSQGDQVTASTQKSTAQGLSVAETGITRVQALFKQYPILASKRYDSTTGTNEWNDLFTAARLTCPSLDNPVPDVIGTNGWIYIAGFGHFKIIKYQPNTPSNGIGTLEVSGTTDKNTSTLESTNIPQGSVSSLSVEIPYATSSTTNPPGLWTATLASVDDNKSIGETKQRIDGNVLTQDCDTSNFDSRKNFPDPNTDGWDVSSAPYIKFPSLPPLPSHITTVTTFGNDDVKLPDDFPVSPDPDSPDTYSYLVPSIDVKSLTVSSGKKVRLYVQGNINVGGKAGISGETNALQIYGSNAAGINGTAVNYSLDGTSHTTTEIGLNGGDNIHAFIFAPAAIAGVKGGGGSGGFYGSIWIKNWAGPPFGSSSDKIVIQVPDNFNWSLLPSSLVSGGGLPGQMIQPVVNWQRKEVTTP